MNKLATQEEAEEGPPVLAGATVVMAGVPTALTRPQALQRLEQLGIAEWVDRHD